MKYSAVDIHRMRIAINRIWGFQHMGYAYKPTERAVEVEHQLQTHMMNETTVEELEKQVKDMLQKRNSNE